MESVELYVRLTARLSAIAFAAALFLFAARSMRRHGIAAFAGFIAIHSVHFGTVWWLAALSGGANVRARGGWPVVVTVALVFYVTALAALSGWRRAAAGASLTLRQRLQTHACVVVIWVIFMNSYASRIPRDPRFLVPAAVLTLAVAAYLRRGIPAARGEPAAIR